MTFSVSGDRFLKKPNKGVYCMVQKIIKSLSLLTFVFFSVSCGKNPQQLTQKKPEQNQVKAQPTQNKDQLSVEANESLASEFNKKLDCGLEEGLSIEDRIKDCGNQEKVLSSGQVLKLVAHKEGQDEVVGTEFYKDMESGLIWETGLSEAAVSKKEAQKICDNKSDLNLKWRLPEADDFLKLGNNSNRQDHNLTVAEVFTNIYTYGSASFWTCSEKPYMYFARKPVLFKNIQTSTLSSDDLNPKKSTLLVQCVASENK